jgi:hypothetical protein
MATDLAHYANMAGIYWLDFEAIKKVAMNGVMPIS